MKLVFAALLAFSVLACDKSSDDSSKSKSPSETGKSGAKLGPLGDDPDTVMTEMLAVMTELKDTAVANKTPCDKLAKAMHAKLDALMPRLTRAKAASKKIEKKWAGKSLDERMKIISKMPQLQKMGPVSDTTRNILTKCASNAEVKRFETRLMKIIGR